ncbi:hypothetical protein TNCV_2741841 [Trichonephila clavipes]|nr:hypothetical protein TNCV_2741841 [Trichonephila clavipes]
MNDFASGTSTAFISFGSRDLLKGTQINGISTKATYKALIDFHIFFELTENSKYPDTGELQNIDISHITGHIFLQSKHRKAYPPIQQMCGFSCYAALANATYLTVSDQGP